MSVKFKHAAEAFVPVPHAEGVVENLCERTRGHCLSIRQTGADKVLAFEDARAILRPTSAGVQMRVEAKDMVVFYGVRVILQGNLTAVAPVDAQDVEWYPADGATFGALNSRALLRRSWSGGR
ncbi:SMa0974 family conjugal transfer regulator [Rhizobium tubonense]|uniref:Uncharacterized protein n=1 Tax=Rhizobium tubonense TaxID=484088 RepID=A0A2W4EQU1_9HYPH|nr:DUF2218 domain-containing protein [Rhizobium tubonense]PZM12950.1 hypothetical protein CPY51_15570 [Rhizobium tubonense]